MADDDQLSPKDSQDDAKRGGGDKQKEDSKKKAPISFGGTSTSQDAWNVVSSAPAASDVSPPPHSKAPLTSQAGKAPLSATTPPAPPSQQPATHQPTKSSAESEKTSQTDSSKAVEKSKAKQTAKPRRPASRASSNPKKEVRKKLEATQPEASPTPPTPTPPASTDKASALSTASKNQKPKADTKPKPESISDKSQSPQKSKNGLPIPAKKSKLPDYAPKREESPATASDAAGPMVEVDQIDVPWHQKLRLAALHDMPAWLVSLIVHFAVLILFLLLTVVAYQPERQVIEATYAEDLGEQLEYNMLVLDAAEFEIEANSGSLETLTETAEVPLPKALTEIDLMGTEAARLEEKEIRGTELAARGEGATKRALLKAYGGSATTEQSVAEALAWLKRNQSRDGSWSLIGPYPDGSSIENKVSATAMALLAFQGAGHTDRSGDHAQVVARGWRFLLARLSSDGSFLERDDMPNQHRPYTQAQATIALCELYAMTGDPELKAQAQAAIDYAVTWQAPEGGWRYTPGVESDLSVTGWFLMALQSARMANLEVPPKTLQNVEKFLETVSSSPEDGATFLLGSRYQYRDQRAERPTPTMTAEGLLCRQYLGWQQDDPRLTDGMEYLLKNPIQWKEPNVYYWYYATQAAHHVEGDTWRNWNKNLRQIVPENQVQSGREKGSWDPAYDEYGVKAGRLFMTCLCTYMLEVYYRHLPIYSKHNFVSP